MSFEGEKIKILQVIGNAQLGGVAACLINYMRHCNLEKYRFDFVTYAPSGFDEKVKEISSDSVIYHVPRFDKQPLKAAKAIKEICRKENYAAVHSHMSILSAVVLPPAASAGIPVRICHAHSTFNRHSDRYIIKKLMRPFAALYATDLMACSRTAAENTFKGKADKATILRNAIEADRFYCTEKEHEDAKEKLGLEKTTALFTGRFAHQKNLKFLLDAFALADRSDMELVLLGSGSLQSELESECKKLGISGKVRFIAPCEPQIWYKAADVFCLPSLYEGLSVSAVEAQAAGLPCLFSQNVSKETDITGACSFIETDTATWAQALNGSFARNFAAKEKIVAAGYDINTEAHRLTDYYDSLLQGDKK